METQQNETKTIPAGWYDGKAKSWRWTQAKTGTWQLEILFEVSERGAARGECIGWFAITDNTIEKRVEQFTALGYVVDSGDLGKDIGCDEQGCWGGLDRNSVRLFIEHDERTGRARVNNISKGNGRAAQTVDAGALAAFGAQMRGAVLAASKRAQQSEAPQQRTAAQRPVSRPQGAQPATQQHRPAARPTGFAGGVPQDNNDDDIPF